MSLGWCHLPCEGSGWPAELPGRILEGDEDGSRDLPGDLLSWHSAAPVPVFAKTPKYRDINPKIPSYINISLQIHTAAYIYTHTPDYFTQRLYPQVNNLLVLVEEGAQVNPILMPHGGWTTLNRSNEQTAPLLH